MSNDLISDELPTAAKHLKIAVLLIFLFIALCLWADWWSIEKISSLSKIDPNDVGIIYFGTLRSILENLIASALAVLLLGLIYRFVIAWIDPADRVVEVSAAQITNRLIDNAKKSKTYFFIGNTATFVTTTVIPVLADAGRTAARSRTITLFLIDPLDQITVKNYCDYTNRVLQETTKVSDAILAKWTRPDKPAKIQNEFEIIGKIIAAIYLTAFGVGKQNISAAVYLRRTFTPFRVDLSDNEAVVTQESVSQSAVAFSSRGHFYSWYLKDTEALRGQSIYIDMTSLRNQIGKILVDPSSKEDEILKALKNLLHLFKHLRPLTTNVAALDFACKRIANPKNAYGN